MMFIEASAATAEGVKMAFEEVSQKIIETPGLWEADEIMQTSPNLDQDTQSSGGYGCC